MIASPITNISIRDIEQTIDKLMPMHFVPGVSMVLRIKDEFVILNKGVKNVDTREPITKTTTFRIASLTKQYFAYLVLKLEHEGVIDLDIPLSSYLPNYFDTPYIDEITGKHVLSHTTGFPNWCYNKPLIQEFKPGTRFQYSGEGYTYLQNVIEKVTGKNLNTLINEYLFNPLEMTYSESMGDLVEKSIKVSEHDEEGNIINRSNNFTLDEITKRRIKPNSPSAAGSMWSTALEYATFLYHLMENEEKIWTKMCREQIYHADWDISWGLGIGIYNYGHGKAVWQWGSELGFRNIQTTYLDYDYSIVIFTNSANGKSFYHKLLTVLTNDTFPFIEHI